jgi:histidyl-tRNA synthetase
MADRFQAPRGTSDALPADAAARERIERTARELFERAGYSRIETPVFEDTELFARRRPPRSRGPTSSTGCRRSPSR